MIAYEFYWREGIKGYQLMGILPERRKKQERISNESIMNWAKRLLGKKADESDIYYVKVTINNNGDKLFRINPYSKNRR